MYRAAIFISHWNWVNRRHTWNLILRQRSGRRNMTGWQPGRTRHDASWWCTMTHRDVSWCAMMAYLPQKIGKNWKKLAKVEKKIGKNVTMKLDKIGTNCTKRQLTRYCVLPEEIPTVGAPWPTDHDQCYCQQFGTDPTTGNYTPDMIAEHDHRGYLHLPRCSAIVCSVIIFHVKKYHFHW